MKALKILAYIVICAIILLTLKSTVALTTEPTRGNFFTFVVFIIMLIGSTLLLDNDNDDHSAHSSK